MKRIRMMQTLLLAAIATALMQTGTEAFLQTTNRRAEESNRETQQRVGDIFKALGANPGAVIADIGAGQGFFTVRLARAVGDTGRVLAVDVSPSALGTLRSRIEEEALRTASDRRGR